ncbi:MAG: hypothetical protein ATN36_00475 [Epulopiscium sp. Nele67-Bin005]|nr:MAG: hypothetical protein ATN36_00475 [Epulopiscium sp. Nele67-Bin005]
MAQLLTHQQLSSTLFELREILVNFDFSALKNIRFFNVESFFSYMESVDNNPFKKQYALLNKKLDVLQPYLPFIDEQRANQFLDSMANCTNDSSTQQVKKDFTKILRQDFLNFIRTLKTEEQWESVVCTCEEIRLHKEEMCLVAYE